MLPVMQRHQEFERRSVALRGSKRPDPGWSASLQGLPLHVASPSSRPATVGARAPRPSTVGAAARRSAGAPKHDFVNRADSAQLVPMLEALDSGGPQVRLRRPPGQQLFIPRGAAPPSARGRPSFALARQRPATTEGSFASGGGQAASSESARAPPPYRKAEITRESAVANKKTLLASSNLRSAASPRAHDPRLVIMPPAATAAAGAVRGGKKRAAEHSGIGLWVGSPRASRKSDFSAVPALSAGSYSSRGPSSARQPRPATVGHGAGAASAQPAKGSSGRRGQRELMIEGGKGGSGGKESALMVISTPRKPSSPKKAGDRSPKAGDRSPRKPAAAPHKSGRKAMALKNADIGPWAAE